MKRDSQSAAEIREGLLRNRPRAVEAVRGWIAAMVYGAGWNLEDPEAAIQEITLRVLHLGRSGRIRANTDFKSFVLTVARHECIDVYRREKLRSTIETENPGIQRGSASTDNPQAQLEEKERRELLRFIFQALPRECRRLWRWLYGDGLTATEVATRLGVTAVNARVRVHRCLKRARKIREEYALGARPMTRADENG